jgi:hypothetical protein
MVKARETNLKMLQPNEAYDMFNSEVSWGKAYCSYFGAIPSLKLINGINTKKCLSWIESSLRDHVIEKNFVENYCRKKGLRVSEVTYILRHNIIVSVNILQKTVSLYYSKTQLNDGVDHLWLELTKFTTKSPGKSIYLVVSDMGTNLTALTLKRLRLDLTQNYNDDLVGLHESIVSSLNSKGTSGLFLFHGVPGTGKSTYIRSLIFNTSKKIIFLPPSLARNMDNPEITSLIISNPNSVIIIEDAEELIVSRDKGSNPAISMLLNLTDGLLGYCLGIKFICTFNTPLNNIDNALLRKGRLTTLYEFKALTVQKTNLLLNKMRDQRAPSDFPLTVADIYNRGPEVDTKQTHPIGFPTQRL